MREVFLDLGAVALVIALLSLLVLGLAAKQADLRTSNFPARRRIPRGGGAAPPGEASPSAPGGAALTFKSTA